MHKKQESVEVGAPPSSLAPHNPPKKEQSSVIRGHSPGEWQREWIDVACKRVRCKLVSSPRRYKHPLLLSTHFFWSSTKHQEPHLFQPKGQIRYLPLSPIFSSDHQRQPQFRPCIYLSGASLQGVKDGRLRDVPPRLPAFCDRGQLDRSGGCVLGHGSFPQHVGDGKHCLKMEFRCPGKRRKVGWWTRFALGMEHGGGRPGRQKQGANHTQGRSVGDEPSLTAMYSLLLLFAPLRPPHQPSSLHLPPLPSRSLSSIRAAFPWAILCCHGLGRVSFRMSTRVIAAAATAAATAAANPSHTPQHHVPHKAHQRRSAQDLLSTPSRLPNPCLWGAAVSQNKAYSDFNLRCMRASQHQPTLFLHPPSNSSKHITHD